MVAAAIHTIGLVHRQGHFLSDLDHALFHMSDMTILASNKFYGVIYDELAAICIDHALVTLLTTHGSVKWCHITYDGSILALSDAVCKFRYHLALGIFFCRSQYCHLTDILQLVVSGKFGCDGKVYIFKYRCVCAHIVGCFTSGSCLLTLFFHTGLKSCFIIRESLFFQDLLCQIYRESISVIQLESILAGKFLGSRCDHVLLHLC